MFLFRKKNKKPDHTKGYACPRANEGPSFFNGKPTEWRKNHTCSYCGSLDPDRFFEMVDKEKVVLTPTDKTYKVYVGSDNLQYGKMYFQHFTEDHKTKFIDLINAKKVEIAYPGHFYVLPFFCGREYVN